MIHGTRLLRRSPAFSLLAALLALAACDSTTGPEGDAPALQVRASTSSSNGKTVVVSSEGELRAALTDATPGDIVQIAGLIEVTDQIRIDTDDLTIQGADKNSGLVAAEDFAGNRQRFMLAAADFDDDGAGPKNLKLEELVLDAKAEDATGAFFAVSSDNVQVVGSDVRCDGFACLAFIVSSEIQVRENELPFCSAAGCIFISSSDNAEVAENRIEAADGFRSGIHVQRGSDNARIRENEVVATDPQTSDLFGGIRVVASADASIRANEIEGPWVRGMRLTEIQRAGVAENRISDAQTVGILVEDRDGGESEENLFQENVVEGSGELSCKDETSGDGTAGTANTWVENQGEAPSDPAGIC